MSTATDAAERAVRLASADARAARRLAGQALAAAPEAEARSVAERALGLAAIELGQGDAAVAHLRSAVAWALASGVGARVGEARMSLSWALTLRGATGEALVEADRAAPLLAGAALARLEAQRALILQRLGRLDEALDGYRLPLAAFRRAGDRLWEARLLCNRGVLQVYRGALGAAEADLVRAEALHAANGQTLAATQVRHNLGWLAARRGDVPAALGWYDRVEAEYREHEVPLALLLMDRCEVLLAARLTAEARANAAAAVAELSASGMGSDLAEAHLLAAQAELLAGDAPAARRHAAAADAAFARQRRTAWAALARAAAAQAAWLEAAVGSSVEFLGLSASNSTLVARAGRLEGALAAARRAIRALDAAGWGVEALDARLLAGRAALELGRPRLARRQLELAAAARHRGPVRARTRAWHAAALLRLSHGDRRGASAAVAAGLRVLEAHRMTLGATELRAHASGHGEELATLGLRLAVDSGSAARVLAAAERRRAAALLLRPTRPPDDAELAAELAELRRVTAALDEALRDGRPDPALARRQTALERAVRRRALRAAAPRRDGAAPPAAADPVSLDALQAALGERRLVEYFVLDGRLYAVTIARGRASLHRLGRADQVDREAASLRFALRRLATTPPGSRAAGGLRDLSTTIAERLDALLLAPLAPNPDRPLVIVPTGELHALPYALLPSLATTPVAVAPSARLWLRAHAATPPPRGARVLAAGPRLPAAAREIATLAARHPTATALTGDDATVANVARALDGAGEAHLAAHGRFRDDNPLFCSLELADGALTVYDLERLRRTPHRLLLSSCESGLSAVRAGDELMGFAAALLALGTATVIAAVVPVPDESTAPFMLALQDELAKGTPPAEALVTARGQRRDGAAFICFGTG